MSVLDTLIYDRTQEDVDLVKLLNRAGISNMGTYLADFRSGKMKGAYDKDDLNRVEQAVEYVAAEMAGARTELQSYATSLGVAWDDYYDVPFDPDDYSGVTVKKNWSVANIPKVADMTRYINNLKLIQAAYGTAVPLPDSMDCLTFEVANNIEMMLLRAHEDLQADLALKKQYILSAAESYRSGDIYSGEGVA